MEGPDRATWFAGDLDDPWVASIAGALPRDSVRIHCPGDLPESWPGDRDRATPDSLVLHRADLNATDAQRLVRLKARADRPLRVVLCLGPLARHAEVERWSRLVDSVIPEATAPETVLRHALGVDRPPKAPGAPRPRVAVVSSNFEMRMMLAEAARSGGFAAEGFSEPVDAPPGVVAAWDVPVLEDQWPARLSGLAEFGPVVALLGFADRATVTRARQAGASACLDLPCDVGDLLSAFDRLATARRDQPHELPPAPATKRPAPARKRVETVVARPGGKPKS